MSEDFVPPTVGITAPANGARVSGLVTVSAKAWDDVGVKNVMFYANGALLGIAWGSPYKILWNTTAFANGAVGLTAYSYDDAGNQSPPSSVQITVANRLDRTPPSVTILNPADESVVSGTVAIKAKAAGKDAITRLHITVDGEILTAVSNAAEINFSWNTRNVASGSHTVSVIANDASANIGATSIMVEK